MTYEIREFFTDPASEPVAVVDADTPRDALADYACLSGFADPRELWGDESGFFTMPDGTLGMTFANQQLYAVVQP